MSADQTEHETYRVIVLDRAGSQVLIVPNGQHHILPWVELRRGQRVAENLSVAVRHEWGEETLGLFEMPANDDGPRYLAAEHFRTRCDPKMPTHWVRVDPLTQNLLSPTTTAVRATATVEATETGVATERGAPRRRSAIGSAKGSRG